MRGTCKSWCLAIGCGGGMLLAACGGSARHAQDTHSAGSERGGVLAKPVYPRCGAAAFAPLPASRDRSQTGWTLYYALRPGSPPRAPRPGETTGFTVIEFPPAGAWGGLKGGRRIAVAGRQVSLLGNIARSTGARPVKNARPVNYVARWRTTTARYYALANGTSPRTLERVIACLL